MNVPVLPRHPPRMLHLSDPDRYSAIAAVARAMGRHCAAAHNGALAALVDAHLDALRDSLEDGDRNTTSVPCGKGARVLTSSCSTRPSAARARLSPKRKAETSETVAASARSPPGVPEPRGVGPSHVYRRYPTGYFTRARIFTLATLRTTRS